MYWRFAAAFLLRIVLWLTANPTSMSKAKLDSVYGRAPVGYAKDTYGIGSVNHNKRVAPSSLPHEYDDSLFDEVGDELLMLARAVEEEHKHKKSKPNPPIPQSPKHTPPPAPALSVAQARAAVNVVPVNGPGPVLPPTPLPQIRDLPFGIATEKKYAVDWFFQTGLTTSSPRDCMLAHSEALEQATGATQKRLLIQWQTLSPSYKRWLSLPGPLKKNTVEPMTREHRKFASYPNAAAFLGTLRSDIIEEDRTMFEIIRPDQPCRWFADVEFFAPANDIKSREEIATDEAISRVEQFLTYVLEAFRSVAPTSQMDLRLDNNSFTVQSATRLKKGKDGEMYIKYSFHVSTPQIYFENLPWALKLFNLGLVMHLLKDDKMMYTSKVVSKANGIGIEVKQECIMDPAPHSKFQNLKITDCHKADDESKTPQLLMTDHSDIDTIVSQPPGPNDVVVSQAAVQQALDKLGIDAKVNLAKKNAKKKKKKAKAKKKKTV
jgi:hypothetical protein